MSDIHTKKLLILYILDILQKYTDEEHRLSQKEIQDILKKEYEMPVDRKAIKRNLLNLIEYGSSIEYREVSRKEIFRKKSVVSDEDSLDLEDKRELGLYCKDPYGCPYWEYCAKELPTPSVFDLYRMPLKKKLEYYREGNSDYRQLKDCGKIKNEKQLRQIEFALEDKVYVDALYQGYLDACRTFKWEKDGKDNKEYIREIFEEKEIVGDMKNYLRADKLESFDEIHKKICVNLIEKCKERTNMTYGQAQKIINMAFKYLYCCKHDSAMEERFKACHMPLDSFSLEWFKRKFKEKNFSNLDSYSENNKELPENLFTKKGEKKLKAESIGSWSSMQTWEEDCKKQEYPYEFYAHVIKQYCKENSITPLQLDFIVWSKMQKIMAAESFIKTFKDDDEENKEVINSEELEPYDILNLKTTLENRLSEIRPLICK